jgi:hypothetical protein
VGVSHAKLCFVVEFKLGSEFFFFFSSYQRNSHVHKLISNLNWKSSTKCKDLSTALLIPVHFGVPLPTFDVL